MAILFITIIITLQFCKSYSFKRLESIGAVEIISNHNLTLESEIYKDADYICKELYYDLNELQLERCYHTALLSLRIIKNGI